MPPLYLSFDCATKTFAFSLSHVSLDTSRVRMRIDIIAELLRREEIDISTLSSMVDAAAEDADQLIQLLDGETTDLFPGVPDDSIDSVDRIKAVARYVNSRIIPALPSKPIVIIEYQMGPNSRSREVASALIALFADYEVVVVGPSLKNRVAFSAEGRYSNFTSRYKTTYAANKAHAKFNFALVEAVFGSKIKNVSPALKGHIADSFMQVIGYLVLSKKVPE